MDKTSFEKIEDALKAYGSTTRHEGTNRLLAQCPAHNDGKPSLSVSYGSGKTLVFCFAGCETLTILDTLNLTVNDLFDVPLETNSNQQVEIASYDYTDLKGDHVLRVIKYHPKTFRQFRWDARQNKWIGSLKGVKLVPYRLPNCVAAIREGKELWIVEGEKDVHAIERMGGVATTNPAGAGKWQDEFTDYFLDAPVVNIVVDQDPPKEDGSSPGRAHAQKLRSSFRSRGIKVKLWKAKTGKDAHDHWAAGHTLDEFVPDAMDRMRPSGVTHDALLTKAFDPVNWVVEGLIPAGVIVLAGSPKVGKSWVVLNILIAVASGGRALGAKEVEMGDALYLAMEDNERRLQERLDVMQEAPNLEGFPRLEFQTMDSNWGTGADSMANMTEWAESVPNPKLVVIDTLAKIEPELDSTQDRYRAEYAMITRYKQWALRYNCAVILVHHDRKASNEDGDWLKSFSGSQGLTGGADTLMFIKAERGAKEGTLYATGKDVSDEELPIKKPFGKPFWVSAGEMPRVAKSTKLTALIPQYLEGAIDGMSLDSIAAEFVDEHTTRAHVEIQLQRLLLNHKVEENDAGRYKIGPMYGKKKR